MELQDSQSAEIAKLKNTFSSRQSLDKQLQQFATRTSTENTTDLKHKANAIEMEEHGAH
jgi:hypothetical protein